MKISINLSYSKYEFVYQPRNNEELISCNVEDKFGGVTDYKFRSEEHALACLLAKVTEANQENVEVVWKI